MSDAHLPLPVLGYKAQSQAAVDLVNESKKDEERLLRALDRMATGPEDFDQRWVAIARTHIEQGFMALNRAVFKPERVKLDGDA